MKETKYLQSLFGNRKLENTIFTMLAPDTKTKLCRVSRSPHIAYRRASSFAKAMNEIAQKYQSTAAKDHKPVLPQMKSLRLAINVAACDGLPIVVAVANDSQNAAKKKKKIASLAFTEILRGRFHFYAVKDVSELDAFKGFSKYKNKENRYAGGIYLAGPDSFGTDIQVADRFDGKQSVDNIRDALVGYSEFVPKQYKSHRQHVEKGIQAGIDWQSETPVTDPMSMKAIQRANERRKQSKTRKQD